MVPVVSTSTRSVWHALADARGAGFEALFAGDRDLPLVTAHVVDELGEKDGGGERERERERVKPGEKCGGDAGLPLAKETL